MSSVGVCSDTASALAVCYVRHVRRRRYCGRASRRIPKSYVSERTALRVLTVPSDVAFGSVGIDYLYKPLQSTYQGHIDRTSAPP